MLIIVSLDESEAMKTYDLDDTDRSLPLNLKPYYHTWTIADGEIVLTMNAHEIIKNELDFDLNNSNKPIEEEVIGMLDERDDVVDNALIEEVDNVQIDDAVVDRVRFKDVESALVIY